MCEQTIHTPGLEEMAGERERQGKQGIARMIQDERELLIMYHGFPGMLGFFGAFLELTSWQNILFQDYTEHYQIAQKRID